MSTPVTIADFFDDLERWGVAVLITVNAEGRPRVVTINPVVADADGQQVVRLHGVGRSAVSNVGRDGVMTLYFAAHPGSDGYSLIVDGSAAVGADGESIDVQPASAVLHRPPPPATAPVHDD